MNKLMILIPFFISLQVCAAEKVYTSENQKFKYENLVQKEDVIWGFDFFKDGRIIFTERLGKLFIYNPKTKLSQEISGVPVVHAQGQGGLLDVRVHPKTEMIYITYSKPMGKKLATTALAVGKLDGNKLVTVKDIFVGEKSGDIDAHFGSRLVFDGKGHIFVSMGDRYERDRAQDLSVHQGKIMRINEDGTTPKDNPFVNNKKAKGEIWSYGHRNPQGLVIDPKTNDLWEAEFGPMGGDEINLIHAGKNYGWPVVTYGREYDGPKIGEGFEKKGMESPVIYWVPSISPSAIDVYYGEAFPAWKGNIFLAALGSTHIHRLVMKETKVLKQEELITDLNFRVRNIRAGKDGYLYLSTDEGKIGRLVPVK